MAIKQKWGVLSYQALPRRRADAEERWSPAEAAEQEAITGEFELR